MEKSNFIKEAMNLKVMELIKDYYNVPDESEALEIYKEIDDDFQKVFKGNEYDLVHNEAAGGYLNRSEYESCKDYWIGEYVAGTLKVQVKLNFKDLEDFEYWKKESHID